MDFFPFDDDYVRRLRDGDRSTEEHFYSYFEPILRLKLRGRLPSVEAAEDVRQDTYFRVLNKLRGPGDGEIRQGHSFGAFVLKVCNNIVLEGYRGKRTEPLSDAHVESLTTDEDVREELIKKQRQECVRRVVNRMGTREREILTAVFFEEQSKEDVCKKFGVSQNYLRVRLHRAREKFREAWAKEQKTERPDPDETDPTKPSLPN